MKTLQKVFCTMLLTVTLMMLFCGVAFATPQLPQSFYGTVSATEGTINGGVIEAVLDGKSFTLNFQGTAYGGNGFATDKTLDVSSEQINHTITFWVNGVQANETIKYTPGAVTRFNLTVKGSPVEKTLLSINAQVNSSNQVSLKVGDKAPVIVTGHYSDNGSAIITANTTFTSSDENVAKVNNGELMGFQAGSATITAAHGGKIATISVQVTSESTGGRHNGAGGTLTIPQVAGPLLNLTDIANSWAKANIEKLVKKGIAQGYLDGTFRPESPITRGEALTMLVKAEGLTLATDYSILKTFRDYEQMAEWVKPYAAMAVQKGLIKGYPDGTLRLNGRITRLELVVLLARLINTNDMGLVDYRDKDLIPAWAMDSFKRIQGKQIITGYPNGTFKPFLNITRAEVATMIVRYSENTK